MALLQDHGDLSIERAMRPEGDRRGGWGCRLRDGQSFWQNVAMTEPSENCPMIVEGGKKGSKGLEAGSPRRKVGMRRQAGIMGNFGGMGWGGGGGLLCRVLGSNHQPDKQKALS